MSKCSMSGPAGNQRDTDNERGREAGRGKRRATLPVVITRRLSDGIKRHSRYQQVSHDAVWLHQQIPEVLG